MSVVQTESREGGSSSIAKRLRRDGFLPMAILQAKGAPELIKAKMADVKKALHENPGVGIFTIQMTSDKEPRTVLVKQINHLKRPASPAAPTTKDCPQCLSKIPLNAKKCAFCTSTL